eukprot:Nk52_evm1s104 gene=Nk52_evmTU1s104
MFERLAVWKERLGTHFQELKGMPAHAEEHPHLYLSYVGGLGMMAAYMLYAWRGARRAEEQNILNYYRYHMSRLAKLKASRQRRYDLAKEDAMQREQFPDVQLPGGFK